VPDALARLALMCKGCGQSLSVPERSTEPELKAEPAKSEPVAEPPKPVRAAVAPPIPRPAPAAVPKPVPVAIAVPESRLPPIEKPSNGPPRGEVKPVSPDDEADFLFEKPDLLAEFDAASDERRAEISRRPESQAIVAPPSPPRRRDRKVLGIVVDVAVALVVIVVGTICGELLAQQSTREVLTDAGSAAKFPPVGLLMWLAPTVLFLLVFALLANRGKTLGAWLRRRGESA
jgi:hypothetical protein